MSNLIKTYFQRHPIRTKRGLEILPGAFSWSLILFPIWGSLVIPEVVAYYVITFAVYWVYRSFTMAVLAFSAHFTIKAAKKFDWMKDLKALFNKRWQKIHHLIIIPTYNEPEATLRRSLESLCQQTFPLKNLHVVLSFEEREGEKARQKASKLQKEFARFFGHLVVTFHPDIPGEVKGKSANTCWGAKLGKKLLVDKEKIPITDITVTSEDADARFHPSYFANITYEFLNSKTPYNHIWQGAVVFYNNIWKVPIPVRVIASIYSVTQMYILKRADRLINFSSYTTTLKHVDSIGYWDTDVIPEDYRLFFKSYFAKNGRFWVKPIFLPVYVDAAESSSLLKTLVNQYHQLKRWAWGVSDDAYIIRQYILADNIPFFDKTIRVIKTIEDHFLWPVNWFAVTIAAFFPPLLNENFSRSILGKTLPQATSTLLTISLLSMVAILIIDAANLPPRPKKRRIFSLIQQPLEFILLPVIGFFFSALPGIDAHTRLMLGKYIEYRVTEKV